MIMFTNTLRRVARHTRLAELPNLPDADEAKLIPLSSAEHLPPVPAHLARAAWVAEATAQPLSSVLGGNVVLTCDHPLYEQVHVPHAWQRIGRQAIQARFEAVQAVLTAHTPLLSPLHPQRTLLAGTATASQRRALRELGRLAAHPDDPEMDIDLAGARNLLGEELAWLRGTSGMRSTSRLRDGRTHWTLLHAVTLNRHGHLHIGPHVLDEASSALLSSPAGNAAPTPQGTLSLHEARRLTGLLIPEHWQAARTREGVLTWQPGDPEALLISAAGRSSVPAPSGGDRDRPQGPARSARAVLPA